MGEDYQPRLSPMWYRDPERRAPDPDHLVRQLSGLAIARKDGDVTGGGRMTTERSRNKTAVAWEARAVARVRGAPRMRVGEQGRKMMEIRLCKACGEAFEPNSSQQLFCTREHRPSEQRRTTADEEAKLLEDMHRLAEQGDMIARIFLNRRHGEDWPIFNRQEATDG
jgi:hypothetical protein